MRSFSGKGSVILYCKFCSAPLQHCIVISPFDFVTFEEITPRNNQHCLHSLEEKTPFSLTLANPLQYNSTC
jgi:hypothetical protein